MALRTLRWRNLLVYTVAAVCLLSILHFANEPQQSQELSVTVVTGNSQAKDNREFFFDRRDCKQVHLLSDKASSQFLSGCPMPELVLHDVQLDKHYNSPPPLQCNTVEKNWVYLSGRSLFVFVKQFLTTGTMVMYDRERFREHNGFHCSLTEFWRKTDQEIGTRRVPINRGHNMTTDFAKVTLTKRTLINHF